MKCTTILLIATLLIGGTQACTEVEECGDQAFDSLDLEPYNGQDIGCRTFFELHRFEGLDYAVINNYCADLQVITVISCLGDTVDYRVINGADYINILGLVKE